MTFDECLCCGDVFPVEQITESGFCTLCRDNRITFNQDGIPSGRPCCRRYLSQCRKEGVKAEV